MRSLPILTVVALLNPLIPAQAVDLLASNLPACASQCTALTDAEGSCTPPLAPVTSDTIYESCFCQSELLTSLYEASAVQVCTSCSAADMMTIQMWYQGVCSHAGESAPNFGNPATSPLIRSSTPFSSVTSSTSTSFVTLSSTQTLSTVASLGPSPSPTAASFGPPTIAKIGIGVGVPLGVIVFTSMTLFAYRFGQRKQRTEQSRELHSSTINEREKRTGDDNGNGHWVECVPEIYRVEIPVHSWELEGSLGQKRHELP